VYEHNDTELAQYELPFGDRSLPWQTIRTETVFSKLPFHVLSKRERVRIKIEDQNDAGEVQLYWEVSYNEKYGPARLLAYELDAVIINRRIDEAGRPLPRLLHIGSIKEILREMGKTQNGKNSQDVKKALRQNGGSLITAKLRYKDREGKIRTIDGDFNRYSPIFTGERLPSGETADGVYIVFNEIYREVLNRAPVRPLDYDYLKQLPGAARRCYELLSYRMYSAFRNNWQHAQILYSEYCTFAAQTRHFDLKQVTTQMGRLHRPHIDSGYISSLHYKQTRDSEGRRDWIISYIPGPKAEAEFKAYNRRIGNSAPEDRRSLQLIPGGEANVTAESLVRAFHRDWRGDPEFTPTANSKELAQAAALVADVGPERADYVLQYAMREAPKTKFNMRFFGAVLHYKEDALRDYPYHQERMREMEARSARALEERRIEAGELALQEEAERLAEAELLSMSEADYASLRTEALKTVKRINAKWLSNTESAIVEQTLRSHLRRQLADKHFRSLSQEGTH
jgi:hypothetical protein